MTLTHEISEDLCKWYAKTMAGLQHRDCLEQYELLLCASDLEIDSPTIRRCLVSLVEQGRRKTPPEIPLLHAIVRLLVFTRFDVGKNERRSFLDQWVNSGMLRTQGVFVAASLVGLALMNQQLLTPRAAKQVGQWYLRHKNLRSDKLAAWAPYCLQMANHGAEARARAVEALSRRHIDGSWGQERKRTIGCAYALAVSGVVPPEDFAPTLGYIAGRYEIGAISELSLRCQLLRLLCLIGLLSDDQLCRLRQHIGRAQRVFVSYSRRDMAMADRMVQYLDKRGYAMWIDRSGIAAGDEWPERLAAGVNDCDAVLMLISESALSSDYCSKEVLYAIRKKKPMVAVHLDSTTLPDKMDLMLGDIQRLKSPEYDDFEAFLSAVDEGLQRLQSGELKG